MRLQADELVGLLRDQRDKARRKRGALSREHRSVLRGLPGLFKATLCAQAVPIKHMTLDLLGSSQNDTAAPQFRLCVAASPDEFQELQVKLRFEKIGLSFEGVAAYRGCFVQPAMRSQ